MNRSLVIALTFGCAGLSSPAIGQVPGAARIAAQREAMAPLARLDGVWRGKAWTMLPTGMNAGVRISPRCMRIVPVRAAPSIAPILKEKRAIAARS